VADESFAAGLVGVVLDGRYRLDALLGEGGMGAVYRATQLANDRKVAVKLLKPHLTTDQAALERFAREARSTLKVDSPHAVKVSDFGITPHGDYYMVLEYLDGRTVQRELDIDGPFEPRRVIHIARQALLALGAAHAVGIVHRDIKPDNLLLMRAGDDADYTKVLDFGVAKLMEGAASSTQSALAITAAGMVFGTPEFMSPEQACGQILDGRSDLYALAATMFAMLTGRGMYQANTPIEWLTAHARKPPPHLADGKPDLAAYGELDRVLQQCLAKHKEQRPADAAAMIAMLDEVEPTLARAPGSTSAAETVHALPTARPTIFSQSTFTQAVPAEVRNAASPVTTGFTPAHGRRGLWIALGGAAITAMVVVAIVFAARGRSPKQPPPPLPVAKAIVPVDAAVPEPPPIDAAIAVDAVVVPPPRPRSNPVVDQHLAAAESARRAGKWMKEIEQAHAVLGVDAHNVKATLLLADGLFHENDIPTGCKYLRGLGSNPVAVARARQAGCSTD
jgi:serine/threonine protein kinase